MLIGQDWKCCNNWIMVQPCEYIMYKNSTFVSKSVLLQKKKACKGWSKVWYESRDHEGSDLFNLRAMFCMAYIRARQALFNQKCEDEYHK